MSERIRGAVFDLNGTLVDDIRFHFEAWVSLATKLGATLDEDRFQSFNGLKNEDIFPQLLGRRVTPEEVDTLGEEKEVEYRRLYRPHLALVPGALDLLVRLRSRGVRLAVASSAPLGNRAMVLDGLALREHFDVIVATETLPGKPAPDPFLAAARELGVRPQECIAFEDAANGVRSAVAAGMDVVGITTNNVAETLLAAGARWAVDDFRFMPGEVESRLTGE